jgi:serine protease Do
MVRSVAVLTACITCFAAGQALAATPGACESASLVARVLPSVVNISVAKILPDDNASAGSEKKEKVEFFVGSGAIIDPSGIIITNKHVIQNAARILVTFHDKSQVSAQLIGAATLLDLALLKVDVGKPLPALQFADSDKAQVGEPVIAVGNPLGLGTSVSAGVISAVDRDLMKSPFDDFLQTDATINPGNSGGPLLDCAGDIVGINTALLSNNKEAQGSIGIGFSLPSNDARLVTTKLMHPETDSPNWVGLHLQDMAPLLAKVFKYPALTGAVVTGADKDSPAAHASLTAGDIITAVNGDDYPDARAILRHIVILPPGQPITLSAWRDGKTREVTLEGKPWPHLMQLRDEVLASAASIAHAEAGGVGLHLVSITAAERQHYALGDTSGLLVDRVSEGSQASSRGLKMGDVIMQVDGQPVTTPSAVMARLNYGKPAGQDLVSLLVRGKDDNKWWTTMWVGRIDASTLVAAPMARVGAAVDAAAAQKK